jgi:hypothetical protein
MSSRGWAPAAPIARTNRLAIAALVCGIVQFGYPFAKGFALAGIAAIILGHRAIRQINRSGDRGYGLAKAGLILGYAVLALSLIGIIAVLATGSAGPALPSH